MAGLPETPFQKDATDWLGFMFQASFRSLNTDEHEPPGALSKARLILLSHVPNMAMVSYVSNTPQDDVGNYSGLYTASSEPDRLPSQIPYGQTCISLQLQYHLHYNSSSPSRVDFINPPGNLPMSWAEQPQS